MAATGCIVAALDCSRSSRGTDRIASVLVYRFWHPDQREACLQGNVHRYGGRARGVATPWSAGPTILSGRLAFMEAPGVEPGSQEDEASSVYANVR